MDIQPFLQENQVTIEENALRPVFDFNEVNFPGKFLYHYSQNKSFIVIEPVMETIFQSDFQQSTHLFNHVLGQYYYLVSI